METFDNHDTNFETSDKFIVSQEITYHSAFAFEKYEQLQFIDKAKRAVHFQLDLIMEDTCQENPTDQPEYSAWNRDGTRFFFLGYIDPINDLHNYKERWKRWGRIFVIVDVINKSIIKYYQPDIKDPHWNADGTEVLFANRPTEILDFKTYCEDKIEIQNDSDDDLGPMDFRAGCEIMLEMPSPDSNYCLRFYNYPTPPDEPLRLTFSIFQKHNGMWLPIYDLPKEYYLEDNADHIQWGDNSKVITFTVNRHKELFVFDFFYRHISRQVMNDSFHTTFSYSEVPKKLFKQWNEKFLILTRLPRENNMEPYLYQVAFVSMDGPHTKAVAVCQDLLVEDPATIKISDKGWLSFPAYDPERTEHFLAYCDLSTFGNDKEFRMASWELPLVPEDIVWDEDKDNPENSRWQPIIHGHRVLRHQYYFDSNRIYNLPVILK